MKIYALKLQDGCYYVGKTIKSVEERFREHCSSNSKGAWWTKVHPPISIEEQRDGNNELGLTLEYISKYGVDKVRGAHFVKLHPSVTSRYFMKTLVWKLNRGTVPRCERCGNFHPTSECHTQFDCDGDIIPPDVPTRYYQKVLWWSTQPRRCQRCGCTSHSAIKCRSRVDCDGEFLPLQELPKSDRHSAGFDDHLIQHHHSNKIEISPDGPEGELPSSDNWWTKIARCLKNCFRRMSC